MVTEKELKGYYNKRFKEGRRFRDPNSYQIHLDYLGVQERSWKKILDIGCGLGDLLKLASLSSLSTYGVDISSEAIKHAHITSPHSKLHTIAAEKLPFGNERFDYITCLGSLEHFIDMEKALKEMVRVAKLDAKFCIMVPNSEYEKAGTEQQEINERLMNLEEWMRLLNSQGLRILKTYKDEYRPEHKGLELWKAYQFIFICQITETPSGPNKDFPKKLEIGNDIGIDNTWETLDIRGNPTIKTDIIQPLTMIKDETYDLVYMSHVLEHVPWYLVITVLKEIKRILKPGGSIEVWVPDFNKFVFMYITKQPQLDWPLSPEHSEFNPSKNILTWLNMRLLGGFKDKKYGFGKQGSECWHKTLFDYQHLGNCLLSVGFKNIKQLNVPRGYDHGFINLGMGGIK